MVVPSVCCSVILNCPFSTASTWGTSPSRSYSCHTAEYALASELSGASSGSRLPCPVSTSTSPALFIWRAFSSMRCLIPSVSSRQPFSTSSWPRCIGLGSAMISSTTSGFNPRLSHMLRLSWNHFTFARIPGYDAPVRAAVNIASAATWVGSLHVSAISPKASFMLRLWPWSIPTISSSASLPIVARPCAKGSMKPSSTILTAPSYSRARPVLFCVVLMTHRVSAPGFRPLLMALPVT